MWHAFSAFYSFPFIFLYSLVGRPFTSTRYSSFFATFIILRVVFQWTRVICVTVFRLHFLFSLNFVSLCVSCSFCLVLLRSFSFFAIFGLLLLFLAHFTLPHSFPTTPLPPDYPNPPPFPNFFLSFLPSSDSSLRWMCKLRRTASIRSHFALLHDKVHISVPFAYNAVRYFLLPRLPN